VATITLPGKVLADLATGLALFAATDSHDTLSNIQLEVSAGYLAGRACDRYRALVGAPVTATDITVSGDDITVLVSAKWLLATAKAHKSDLSVSLELTEHLVSVSTTSGGSSIETSEDRGFPNAEKLFTKFPDAVPTEHVAFNPVFLADIAKIPARMHSGKSAGVAPIKLELHGAGKPASFTLDSDRVAWRGLLMPVRSS
jgi:hypothetical protein